MHIKLWRVVLRSHLLERVGVSYVVAEDPKTAYEMVREYLDQKDYGFRQDRELERVELIAEDNEYTNLPSRLFLKPAHKNEQSIRKEIS